MSFDQYKEKLEQIRTSLKTKCNLSTGLRKEVFGWAGFFLINDTSKILISFYTTEKKFNQGLFNKCKRNKYKYITFNLRMDKIEDLITSIKEYKTGFGDWLDNRANELETDLPKSEKWFRDKFNKEEFFQTMGFKFNAPFKKFIYDCYSQKYSLVIEVDGSIHETTKQIEKDRLRDITTKAWGLRVIRVKAYNNNSYESGINKIKEYLSGPVTKIVLPAPRTILRKLDKVK